MGFDRDRCSTRPAMRRGKQNVYFDVLADKELLDEAAFIADSVAHAQARRPMFEHVSTDQMHVPGFFQVTSCKPYPFPSGLQVDAQTRRMLNSARCTDRDLAEFVRRLKHSGLYDEALIVITADHAFNLAFWDHRETELARIPLFVKLPRSMRRATLDTAQLAAQIDIAPTILDVLGLESSRPMYGRSLLGVAGDRSRTSIAGVSSSRLLSFVATPDSVVFTRMGSRTSTIRRCARSWRRCSRRYCTSISTPDEFQADARNTPPAGRWLRATSLAGPARAHEAATR